MEKREDVLIPIDEQSVDFYGDEISAALVTVENNTQMYIPLRPICEYLGLSWSGQYERINRDPILSQKIKLIRLKFVRRRGNRISLCLPLDLLHGWLFGVTASRVKPQIIPKLICYQKECFTFLWREFQIKMLLEDTGIPYSSIAVLEQIRQTGLTIAHEAEQQIQKELGLNVVEGSLHML